MVRKVWVQNFKDRRWHLVLVNDVGHTKVVDGVKCLAPNTKVYGVVKKGKRF